MRSRNRNIARKKPKPRKQLLVNDNNAEYKLLSYEISDEPIIDRDFRRLPRSIQDELENIYQQLNRLTFGKDTHLAISRLEELVEQYPHIPNISNYLAAAYFVTHSNKFEVCVQENYRKHPDYLFARIHYAEQCLKNNEAEKINEIFKEGLDLKLLYPQRNRFHVSEYIGFSTLMCRYYVMIAEQQAAELILQSLEKIAPGHPAIRKARRIVRGTFLTRIINKFRRLILGNRGKNFSDGNKQSGMKA